MPQKFTAQKMKFSINDFFSKCDQIPRLLKKSLIEFFVFCPVVLLKTFITDNEPTQCQKLHVQS